MMIERPRPVIVDDQQQKQDGNDKSHSCSYLTIFARASPKVLSKFLASFSPLTDFSPMGLTPVQLER